VAEQPSGRPRLRTRRAGRGRKPSTGDPRLDLHLQQLLSDLPVSESRIALETVISAVKLAGEDLTRLDRKIINSTIKELRYAFHVFAPYRHIRKVSIFGSARTSKEDAEYAVAREFASKIADRGWMVITGAGPGIMEAGHEGAGGERSFGANIRLPMEAEPNTVIAEDEKLINFKYFFTRKLTFIKEAHAFVLFPGGFGTLDESFELLTLIQTGKSDLHPIVMLDQPGGTYWSSFDRYVREALTERGFISPEDSSLYRLAATPEEAVEEIESFYRVYHSQRVVDGRIVLRLNRPVSPQTMKALSDEFDSSLRGPIEVVEASEEEIRDDDVPDLPRIALGFDWEHAGVLRRLIDRLNET